MLYNLSKYKDKKVEEMYKKAIKELDKFYNVKLEYVPSMIIVNSREEINNLQCKETEPWVVGWMNYRLIYVLNKNHLETESNHEYSDIYYSQLIKHELSHYYYNKIFPIARINWLDEGLATYSSGQYLRHKKPEKFDSFLKYISTSGKDIYGQSGYAIYLLINKYGKEKLFDLLIKLKEYKQEKDLFDFFKKIYGFKLSYENMNKLLVESDDK